MEFKEKLKKLRTENGLTQEALADAVHISRSAIAKYENGNGNPSEETLMALAIYFGVEVNDLKDDSEIKRKTNKATIKTAAIIVTSVIVLGGIVIGSTFGILLFTELAVVFIFSLMFKKLSPTVVTILYFAYA